MVLLSVLSGAASASPSYGPCDEDMNNPCHDPWWIGRDAFGGQVLNPLFWLSILFLANGIVILLLYVVYRESGGMKLEFEGTAVIYEPTDEEIHESVTPTRSLWVLDGDGVETNVAEAAERAGLDSTKVRITIERI